MRSADTGTATTPSSISASAAGSVCTCTDPMLMSTERYVNGAASSDAVTVTAVTTSTSSATPIGKSRIQ